MSCRSWGVDEARELARWPGLANLRELDLGASPWEDVALEALIASPHWSSRTALWIGLERGHPARDALARRVRLFGT